MFATGGPDGRALDRALSRRPYQSSSTLRVPLPCRPPPTPQAPGAQTRSSLSSSSARARPRLAAPADDGPLGGLGCRRWPTFGPFAETREAPVAPSGCKSAILPRFRPALLEARKNSGLLATPPPFSSRRFVYF
jgi:hypothetical protein